MAVSSGVCYSSKARDSRLKIEWEKTGTWSSTTCGTNIKWRLILENGNYWYNNAIRCYEIYINGNKVSEGGTWSNYTTSGNHTLIDWQNVSIEHNTNGSEKTFNINFSGWFYSSYDVRGSTDFTLPKIPRYTSITSFVVNKRDETSVTVNWNTADIIDKLWYSKDDGNNWVEQTITQGKSGNFNITSGLSAGTLYTFKIKVRRKDSQLETESLPFPQSTYSYPSITTIGTPDLMIGDAQTLILYNPLNRKNISIYMKNSNKTKTFYSGTLAEGTSITFTPNASTMYENIPDDPIGDCVYYCVWSNHTSEDKSGAYRIIGNENPSYVSYTYADTNSETLALTGNNQILIKGHSNVRATVTPESKALPCPNVYSRILRYNFVNGSKSTPANYSDNATVTMDITAIEDNHLTLYAIESRGLSNYLEYALDDTKFKNYADVTISSVTAVRGSNGVGKEVTLTFSGTFWNNSFGSVTNDFDTLKYYYKLTTANIWTEGTTTLTATKSGDNYSGSFSIRGDLGAEGFDVANSYNIRLVVADKLSTRTYETTLGSGTPAIAIYKNKVAIGGKYDTSGTEALQVNGDAKATKFKGNVETGSLLATSPDLAPIIVRRTGNPYASAIRFENSNGMLGGIGFTGTANGRLQRWNKDFATGYEIIDRSVVKAAVSAKSHTDYNNNQTFIPTMNFLTYWNGAFNSGNSSNLTYAHQGTIQCKPTNLYNNTSGNNGSVTLSQSSANFTYIEISHSDNNNAQRKTTRIYDPNGKNIDLFCIEPGGGNMYFRTSMYEISGTSITFKKGTFMQVNGGSIAANYEAQFIKIFRVDGYK